MKTMKDFKGSQGNFELKRGNQIMVNDRIIARVQGDILLPTDLRLRQEESDAKLFAASKKLLEALIECQSELYSIHSQYGDKQNAEDNSIALQKAKQAINESL
jgi:hypothetical protein